MKYFALLITVLSMACLVSGKVYLSCELAKEFSRNDMERHLIPHWICLVQAESQGNTSKTIDMPNLTTNYGIFQVKEFHNFLFMVFTHVPSYIVLCRSTAKNGAAKIRKVETVTSNAQVETWINLQNVMKSDRLPTNNKSFFC